MIPIKATVQSALPEFQEVLEKYRKETGKTGPEVLTRKGKDLTLRIYREYRKLKPQRGEVYQEAEIRHRAFGRGTRVRQSILNRMKLRSNVKSRKVVFGNSKYGRRFARRGGSRLNWRAEAVRRELATRSRGSGYLSIGWLFNRWRGTDKPRSRSMKRFSRRLQFLAKTDHKFTQRSAIVKVENVTPGAAELDRARGITRKALGASRADTLNYLKKRQGTKTRSMLLKKFRLRKVA